MKKISKIFESNNLLRNKIFVLNFDDEFKTLLHAHKDYHKIKYPPCIAEEKYYIKNISYNYNMLDNLSDEELENLTYIFMKDEKITNFLFDELIKLNKELSIFKDYPFLDEKFYKKSCVIGGVCSKMNINDIKDYIDLDAHTLNEIKYFFEHNKDLEKGKFVKIENFVHANEANTIYNNSIN
jgi:hypothetical protein